MAVFELLPSAYVATEGEPGAAIRPYHGMVTAGRPPDLRGAPRVLPGPPSGVTSTAVTWVTAVALACRGAADPLAGAAAAGAVAGSSVGTVPGGNRGAGAVLAEAAAAASVRAA